jgi:hypothetical protein
VVKIKRKEIIGFLLVVAGVVLFGGLWVWCLWPESPQTVTFHKVIERLATEKGIPVIEVEKLEVRFGKAIGAPIVTAKDPQQFFELCGQGKILVANEINGYEVIRKYWAVDENYVIEYTETYSSPGLSVIRKASVITPEGITFEKAYLALIILATIISGVFGPLYVMYVKYYLSENSS